MNAPDETQLAERISALADDVASPLGVEVLDVVVKGSRGRRLVRVVADAAELDADAGLDIDTIAKMSRQLGDALDEHDVVPGSFTLEVTSPGADRPLRRARDFARNVGREVRIDRTDAATDAADGERELRGVLVAVDESTLTLEVADDRVELPLDHVDHGTVVLPW
jgi:ribosome maturation factor RimP